ncbi:MAG: ankyrin repeat domain-containing protein [Tatlockia sp.]|nr:ankyrin repeat domain-containing protein [Tatlockia sp.]
MPRYTFINRTTNSIEFMHYIEIPTELTKEENQVLQTVFATFPHCNTYWTNQFNTMKFTLYPKELLKIAANAFDGCDNPVLSLAADRGDLIAMKKLIEMGADLNKLDKHNKLALHWAITTQKAMLNRTSLEAVKGVDFLLGKGARIDIVCHEGKTVLEYAKCRGYEAAATIIAKHSIRELFLSSAMGFFSFPKDIIQTFQSYLTKKDSMALILSSKKSYENTKEEFFKANSNGLGL